MKQFHLLLLSFCLLNCSTKNTDNQTTNQVTDKQAKHINTDSTAAANPDIDFDSFLREFSSNKEFQLLRVDFPLKVKILEIEDKEEIQAISKEEWHHTNLLDTANIKSRKVDAYSQTMHVNESEAIIELRGIDNGISIDYKFQKVKGRWYLKEILNAST
ncbi:DUF4348 domain-containing protein [Marivirga sp. S37H4]|uniref:DUF4348 domain-containing protein n=1 Tax=Marivirga aurantiaca TaxID=2802615 RepID=A0A935C8U6_9BACT|nr:DUF4348 domain-containing protein [Marivirga aurantiaca]MBK6265644.1 DUF4348 domain-containing protein [Marivirga aurantiaca]